MSFHSGRMKFIPLGWNLDLTLFCQPCLCHLPSPLSPSSLCTAVLWALGTVVHMARSDTGPLQPGMRLPFFLCQVRACKNNLSHPLLLSSHFKGGLFNKEFLLKLFHIVRNTHTHKKASSFSFHPRRVKIETFRNSRLSPHCSSFRLQPLPHC